VTREGHVGSAEDSPDQRVLHGWGRVAPSSAELVKPADLEDVRTLLSPDKALRTRGVIARGLGRSYGDAAQCAGGTVIDMAGFGGIGSVDPESGVVEVGSGVSLEALMVALLPLGWFVPVSPGTRQVTIGGAVAADIHGKNHHVDGSFCQHIRTLTLVTPSGVVRVGPEADAELFWATAGGMGLTGVVTEIELQMKPVETSWMLVDTSRFNDLDDVMAEMTRSDEQYRYSVAWVDCMGGPRKLGRSILSRAEHAPLDALGRRQRSRALRAPQPARVKVPFTAPRGLMNNAFVSAFNELWFAKAPRRREGAIHSLGSFFHPLDGIVNWNLLYGPGGFVQYQFVVSDARADVIHEAVARMSASGVSSFFAVLKRFGPGDPGPLSFPTAGWTLALDFPLGPPALRPLLDGLDHLVAEAGGRVYLAKDSRLSAEMLHHMYSRIEELAAVRRRVDPSGMLRSDLSRRLGIDMEHAS
jgi:decaprenylphospho-beta-D-ribofuranose 2-oxidase